MSVEAVVARVEQLQQLFSAATAPGGNGGQDFASQLTAATSAAVPATTVAPAAQTGATMALSGAAGATSALPPGVPYGAEITAAARKHGIDPALLAGLVRQESNFNPTAGSPAGARGLTQLMPGTAASLGVTDVTDPVQALDGGAKYLKQQLDAFGGDITKALAAYNAGPGAVQRYGGVPPYAETQNYVQKVQAFAAAYRGTPTGTVGAASAAVPSASTSLPYSTV
jgi:soluble lytic murein transglycosylase-like protein